MELINHIVSEYAEQHTSEEIPLLAKLNRETHLTQVYPRMLSGRLQGTFLRMISRMMKPFRILEIGTFTGYSAINLAQGLTDKPTSERSSSNDTKALLHTIEVDPELEAGIMKYLVEAGLQDKVILHIGQAEKIIPTLQENWDIVYIDADKPNYPAYYKLVIDRVNPGGLIIADNALWDGKVLDPSTKNADARGIEEFNDFVQQDFRVENVLLTVRDGIMLVQKKNGFQNKD